MSSNFCYINPKNGLAKDQKVIHLIVKIIQKVSDIPNIVDYKYNLELLTLVCCMIEHGIDNKKEKVKIDKCDIVFQVYNRLFNNMSPNDIKGLTSNITYLHENGRIKKRGLWTVISSSICDWVTRRIL